MALTERDRAILDFERSWWSEPGPKDTAILERFELSATRYYQILGELLDSRGARARPAAGASPARIRDRRRTRAPHRSSAVSETQG
jgi:hypothetical protein